MIAYLSFYKGLEKGDVSLVSPVGATWGLVTAILGVIFFKEALSFTQISAVALIILSVIMLSINIKDILKEKKFKLLIGVKEGIIAMLGWGISLFLLVLPGKSLGWFLPAFIFRSFVLLILSTYIIFSKKQFVPKKIKFPIFLLLLIGIFDVGGFFSYSFGVAGGYASVVAPIGSAFALVSVILAKIFLKEKLDISKIIGICGIVIGLILISI